MSSIEYLIKKLTVIHKITQNVKNLYVSVAYVTEEHTLYYVFRHLYHDNFAVYIDNFFNDNTDVYYINIFYNNEFIESTMIQGNIDNVVKYLNDIFNSIE